MAENTNRRVAMRQVVDWSAAVWAGIAAGIVFLLVNFIAIRAVLEGVVGSGWLTLQYAASLIMGEGVLPPTELDIGIIIIGFLVHMILSVFFAVLLAIVIHRYGLLVGIVGGALFGLGLYFVNIYTFTLVFPWFFVWNSWQYALTHVVFGMVAGGLYEGLEVEEFVPIEVEQKGGAS